MFIAYGVGFPYVSERDFPSQIEEEKIAKVDCSINQMAVICHTCSN